MDPEGKESDSTEDGPEGRGRGRLGLGPRLDVEVEGGRLGRRVDPEVEGGCLDLRVDPKGGRRVTRRRTEP